LSPAALGAVLDETYQEWRNQERATLPAELEVLAS
jgi:hypothetical protein